MEVSYPLGFHLHDLLTLAAVCEAPQHAPLTSSFAKWMIKHCVCNAGMRNMEILLF